MPPSIEAPQPNKFSKKEIFMLAGLSLISITSIPKAIELLSQPLSFDPEKEPTSPADFSHPSFIELEVANRENTPPFIGPKKGHGPYVAHAITNLPILAEITRQAYERTISQPENNLVNTIFDHLHTARNSLAEFYPEKFLRASEQEKEMQTWSAALYSLSGLLGSWMNIEQVKSLGVEIPNSISNSLVELYELWENFPPLIPFNVRGLNDDDYSELYMRSGKDRSVHFANHLFITFKFLQFDLSDMQDRNRIPLASNLTLSLVDDPSVQAAMLSSQGSIAWEVIETLKPEYKIKNGFTHQGLFDPTVFKGDFVANKLGSEIGIAVFEAIKKNQLGKIYHILNKLNDSKYTQPQYTLYKNSAGNLALTQN